MKYSSLRSVATLLMILGAGLPLLAAIVRGSVYDEFKEPMEQATVRLLNASDSSFVKGTLTNAKGRFSFNDVKNGKYIVETSYVGMSTGYTPVAVKGANVTLDSIRMAESSIMLKGVSVTGVKTQIKVMEDTVEFNADSYKTQPNAVVEDLLKRLPGVEVDSEGKITANGQEVKKILIDGKEFFSDDPKVASKNLPVNMVDKLQVVNRKSDLARLTGVDDGEDETVINLTVKPGMKNGYFGTAEGGYGTDDRYLGSFNLNRFWNGNQVTLLGNFNNINELGFTDSNGNRFRRFGGSNGINTSQAVGLNFNVGREEIFRVGGDVMYSHSDRDTRQQTERQYLLGEAQRFSSSGKQTRDKGHNIRADFRIEWKPDSFNTLDFRPNFSYNLNNSFSLDTTLTTIGDLLKPQNQSFNRNSTDGNSLEFGGNLIFNHNFRNRPGRSFSINVRYQHSDVRETENSFARNIFYLLQDPEDQEQLFDQLDKNHTWSNMAMTRLSWTEPLGDAAKGNFLTFAYRLQYRWNNADKIVYDHPVEYITDTDGKPYPIIDYSQTIYNDSLSNRFRNNYFNQDFRIGYKKVSASHNLDVGVSLVPQMSKSVNLVNSAKSIPERWVMNFAPYLRYRYKISKMTSFQANYWGRSQQPSMNQLQPVADMSDPMRIVIGNPNLDPTFTHSINLRFQDFNPESQRSIMAMLNFSASQNSIVSRTVYDPTTGVQTTTYQNVNGVWNGMFMNMISLPLRNKAWQFSSNIFGRVSQQVGFNNGLRNRSNSIMLNLMPSIAFRPDNLEFELRPRYNLQYTTNTLKTVNSLTVHNYGGTFSAYYYTPIGIVLNTDLNFTATRGYTRGYDQNEWMWNASIAYQALKSRALTFTLKAYDLLQQRSNVRRNVTANYIDDIRYNDLTRYFMLTVSYKFNTFGKGNEPESRSGHWGGPMGPPSGGRGGFGGRR